MEPILDRIRKMHVLVSSFLTQHWWYVYLYYYYDRDNITAHASLSKNTGFTLDSNLPLRVFAI
jgi:hypothetical protein